MSQQTSVRTRPDAVLNPWLLSVAVVWGLNNVASKYLLGAIEPAGILAFRFMSCGAIISAIVWLRNRRSPRPLPPLRVVLFTGLFLAAQNLTFMYALDRTTASEGSLIISIAPIWTALNCALSDGRCR